MVPSRALCPGAASAPVFAERFASVSGLAVTERSSAAPVAPGRGACAFPWDLIKRTVAKSLDDKLPVLSTALSNYVVLGAGFLLLISLVLSTALHAGGTLLADVALLHHAVWSTLSSPASFLVAMLLFAAIFKVLPDAESDWSDVWPGAVALVLILLWVCYSFIILLVGAEITQVPVGARGRVIAPSKHAVRVEVSEIEYDENRT